ncbi:hypothetical protein GF412_00990 [Candidatus Micrarchaeota archaeon]|nr:hypothetical protein [Candidatus Micrarchaeota archaeon]MBD3417548.1 hypothetical protein [Candidatus Micrarchaeota archaeon]
MDNFADTHKQCQHCGSYFPAEEAQYFEGMLLCPACHGALEEEEREKEEKMEKAARSSGADEERNTSGGVCERCGRATDVFYMLGGKRLCRICFEASAPDSFSRGPGGSATPIRVTRVEEEKGTLEKIIDAIIGKEEERYEPVEKEPRAAKKSRKKDEG